MSLFPAAGYISSKSEAAEKHDTSSDQSWLQNKSYQASKASKLAEYEQKCGYESSSSEDEKQRKFVKRDMTSSRDKKDQIKPVVAKKEIVNDVSLLKVSYIVDKLEPVSSKTYKADKTGDKDNVHFSRPYKVLIPKFYRDCLFCLGTPNWKRVEMSVTRKKKKRKRPRNADKEDRYFNNAAPTPQTYLPSKFSPLYEAFCALRKEDDDTAAEEVDESFSDTVKKTTERFNRQTRENSNDVSLWKRFVAWQDEAFHLDNETSKARVVIEKKIEILNHAVRSNPKDASLQIMRVRLQSELEHEQGIVDKEWENILFRFPDNMEVWKSYILHINCNSFSAFSIKRTRRAYSHCIEILKSVKEGTYMQETMSEVSGERRLIQLLSEYVDFQSAAGLTEQCVALYQCMLELNFRGPTQDAEWSDTVEHMKLYFEGDNRIVGKPNSKGFAEFAIKQVTGGWVSKADDLYDDSTEGEDEDDDVDPDKSLTENWLLIDKTRSHNHWLPWKPTYKGEECDDDERTVPFSDIKGFLFAVEADRAKIQILNGFLSLLGSPISYATTVSHPFSVQSIFRFTHSNQAMRPYEQLYVPRPFLIGNEQESRLGCLENDKHLYVCNVFQQLFDGTMKNESLHALLCDCYALYFEKRAISFYIDDQSKDLKKCGKEAKKEMKKMLSVKPNFLCVWMSFAVIEWLCSKKQDALKILQTSVAMSVPLLNHKNVGVKRQRAHKVYLLCRVISQLHISTCNDCDVGDVRKSKDCPHNKVLLSVLACLGDGCKFGQANGESLTSTAVAKANSGYDYLLEELQSLYEQFDYEKDFSGMTENEFSSPYFNVVCCFFVFSVYFLPEKTHKIINEAILFLCKKMEKDCFQAKIDLENLYEFYFWYLRESKTLLMSDFKRMVYEAAQKYPCNPHFAWFIAEFDLSSYLSRNVRRHFAKACTDHQTSAMPWLCAIDYELKRRKRILEATNDTGFADASNHTLLDVRIQNLFERALSMHSCPGSAVLWRAYIQAQSQIDPRKIEGLYTRALDSCSWSRDLHLDVLLHHPDKLSEVVGNISKKNLRLRTPVEEVQLLMTF